MRNAAKIAPILALGLVVAGPARAADDVSMPMSPQQVEGQVGDWTFAVGPYLWAAGLSGDVSQFGLPVVHISPDFGDILENLDFAVMVMGEARHDRYSIFGDLMYIRQSVGSGTPKGILAGKVGITARTFAGLLGAGYSVLEDEAGHLDLVAGARVWHVGTDISFSGGILDGRSASDSATWVNGLIGMRGRYALTDNLYLAGWGMVGAGGARLDWDVAVGLDWQFNDRFSATVGYRALGVDYRRNGFVFDAVQQGPIMGLVARF